MRRPVSMRRGADHLSTVEQPAKKNTYTYLHYIHIYIHRMLELTFNL